PWRGTRCSASRSKSPRCGGPLARRPAHDRDAADAVLRAAFDNPVAVGHIDQHVPLTVEEPDDLKGLEDEAAPLVENALTVLDLADDLDRPDLAARDAGVAGVLGDTQSA